MAKAKKSKITLEDALVPDEEWPYDIPKNWCWIRLLNSFDNVTDSKKKLASRKYLEEGEYPIIDQGQEFIGGYSNDESMVYDGTLPIIIFGDHTRCIKYIDFPFVQGADGVKVLRPKQIWNAKAFYYAIQSIEIPNMGYRRHYPLFKEFCIPVPPLAEQKRIIEQIENLFTQLDEAKEKAQLVVDNYEVRKTAIMYKAFTGELTAKWREEKGISTDTWKEKTLQEVCVMKITDGTHKTPTYCEENEGIPFISAKDVNGGFINWENIKYIPHTLHEELYSRLAPQVDDVLLSKNGAKLGVAAIVDCEKIFDIYVTLALLRPNTDIILPRFLLNIINSPICRRQIDNHLTGIGMPNLHLRDIKEILISIPTLEEQAIIIEMVDNLNYKGNQVKNSAEYVIEKIEELKKSILAKAFRGELGTNIETEESALELLKSILK